MSETQLSNPYNYNTANMVFSDIKEFEFKQPNGQPMKYHRINISTTYPDSSVGDLVFDMGQAYSFGVSTNAGEDKKDKGHSLPLCLTSKDGATKNQIDFIHTLQNVIRRCRDHLVENKDQLEDILQVMITNEAVENGGIGNCIFVKKDQRLAVKKGNIAIENVSPMIYPKLIERKNGSIVSLFYLDGDNDESIDPLTLINKAFTAHPVIKVESIYIGSNKYSVQLKVHECGVTMHGGPVKRLIPRPNADSTIKMNVNLENTRRSPPKPLRSPIKEEEEEEIEEKKPPSPPKQRTGVTKPAKKK